MTDLDDWTFQVEETSANVYAARGVDHLGRLVVEVADGDPDAALAAARDAARAMIAADANTGPRPPDPGGLSSDRGDAPRIFRAGPPRTAQG